MPVKRPAKSADYPAPSTAVAAQVIMEVKAGAFKDTCLQLLDEVRDSNVELVVTKYGEAVARVIPPDVVAPSAFGFMSGTLLATGDIVAPDFDAWDDVR